MEIEKTKKLLPSEKFEILLLELELLQGRFDKYDNIIFQTRGWLVTIMLGIAGTALTLKNINLAFLGLVVPIQVFIWEAYTRGTYLAPYRARYRHIRDHLNSHDTVDGLTLYDLTNTANNRNKGFSMESGWARLCPQLKKPESVFFYSFMVAIAIGTCFVLKRPL